MMKTVWRWLASTQRKGEVCIVDNDPRHWSSYEEMEEDGEKLPKLLWQVVHSPDCNSLDFALNRVIDAEVRKKVPIKRMGQKEYQDLCTKIIRESKEVARVAKESSRIGSWRKRLRRIIARKGMMDKK